MISDCLFVWMSDHNPMTDWPQILIGELERTTGMFFKIISLVDRLLQGKIANISIYDQARVNGRWNYEYHGIRRVPRVVGDKIVTGLPTKIESSETTVHNVYCLFPYNSWFHKKCRLLCQKTHKKNTEDLILPWDNKSS